MQLQLQFKHNTILHFILALDCESIAWEHVTTDPALPVQTGTEVMLSCQSGFTLVGTRRAICWNGDLQPSDGGIPSCSEINLGNITILKCLLCNTGSCF